MPELMGVVTVIVVFGVFLLFFLGLLIAGVACLLIYAKRDSRGDNPGAGLPIASAVLMGIGFMAAYFIAFIMIGVTAAIASENSVDTSQYQIIDYIPEDYEYFTVDGERYDALEIVPSYHACMEIGEGKYLEEYEGEYYMYYSIPNEENFDLIFDGYLVMYAPADQHDAIYREYEDEYGDLWLM